MLRHAEDDRQKQSVHAANGDHPVFSNRKQVVFLKTIGIIENKRGRFEGNPVLSAVCLGLVGIPFKGELIIDHFGNIRNFRMARKPAGPERNLITGNISQI